MAIITELKYNKTNTVVAVYLDGDKVGVATPEQIYLKHIKVDMDISDDELEDLLEDSGKSLAFESLAIYLSKYSCSIAKAGEFLAKKGYSEIAIEIAIDKALEYNYLDDSRIARETASVLITRNSKLAISDKLRRSGIPQPIIREVLAEFDIEDELEASYKVARVWSNTKDIQDKTFREKLYRYMSTKGYRSDIISATYKKLRENKDED